MTAKPLLPGLGCLTLLLVSACATDGAQVRSDKPAATLESVIAEADRATAAGQSEQALALLKGAAASYPADKAPWLTMAQLKFDRASYGEAISHALEALQRDPIDKHANSIVAVSGLRLSTKALADLTQQNNLNGSWRTEAQDLARLLRTSLGEEVLVPPGRAPVKPALRRSAAPVKPSGQSGGADPFGTLRK